MVRIPDHIYAYMRQINRQKNREAKPKENIEISISKDLTISKVIFTPENELENCNNRMYEIGLRIIYKIPIS